MRTKTLVKGLKNSQKIRVIVDEVGFYTTVGEIDKIITARHGAAVRMALMRIASDRQLAKAVGNPELSSGFAFTYTHYSGTERSKQVQVQVDLI